MGGLTIWKFPVPVADEVEVSMPTGARILSLNIQDGQPRIWAFVDILAAVARGNCLHHTPLRVARHRSRLRRTDTGHVRGNSPSARRGAGVSPL